MTFLEFCKSIRHESSPEGDVARDWILDRNRPRNPKDWATVRRHVCAESGGWALAVRAARKCWVRYEKIQNE